jgi:hypothetical protein
MAVESVEQVWKREVGERLRLLMLAVGVECDHDMAEALDVAKFNWANWRRGHILLPPKVARKLKQLYGCAFDWLYLGERSNNTAKFNALLSAAERRERPKRSNNG